MCGIAGFTHQRAKLKRAVLEDALEAIRHRGPDQRGYHFSEQVSMGAVRLKILDLESGDQPVRAADGDCVIVFNGEIYNYRELRAELESYGHKFQTNSDTEVVLHAWMEWDMGFLTRLRGMFALALWKESEKRLVLARDRMGIKPLYIHRRGADIWFGSELKALFAHPGMERRLNAEAVNYYLALNYVPFPFTLVEGIEKLEPGGWLEWRDGEVRTGNYWRLYFEPRKNVKLEAAAEELDGLLDAAVREHMISDVPLGVWLSGGLDSSTITHYAARASAKKLKTFSVSFAGRRFDESKYFRQVAAHYGTEHHEFDLGPEQSLGPAIEQMAFHSDEPSADAGAVPVWFLSRMSRKHVTVALSGEGADELFGGYTTYVADRYAKWARHAPRFARRLALRAARRLPVSDEKIGFEYKLKRFLEGTLLGPVEAHHYWNGACTLGQRLALLGGERAPSPAGLFPTLPEVGAVNRFLYLDQLLYLPEDILYKCDRMSMAHSLEVRPPFLDARIVDFAAGLPEHLKVRGGQLKVVLRHLMRDKLPKGVTGRAKEGFDIPVQEWLRGPLKPLLQDTVTAKRVREAGLKWEAAEAMIAQHVGRQANNGYPLWGLMTVLIWMKRWGIEGSVRREAVLEKAAR
ncbi:MAG: asparagine synthase (glutamine-hydrolyzing) [Acidimicrobiia bacterium]|nr:asparagine synthase (glutamine-hydrolyzing) [Acidimicrobiia bacterium]